MIGPRLFEDVVADAMLAPSTHNTQPARWSVSGDTITVWADMTRRLPVGDPNDRDLHISCGAAIEGTMLALAKTGSGARVEMIDEPSSGRLVPLARVLPQAQPNPEDAALSQFVHDRATHREGFDIAKPDALTTWSSPYATLIADKKDILWLAREIDNASARIMAHRPFRKELLSWMRLGKRNPRYETDGLNPQSLAMGPALAMATGPVLGTHLYDLLYVLGLGPTLAGERARSETASAVALFHWPKGRSWCDAGRHFYRMWLEATARGLAAWPAAALADDTRTNQALCARFNVPKNHSLANALRLGAPKGVPPKRARLALADVIVQVP